MPATAARSFRMSRRPAARTTNSRIRCRMSVRSLPSALNSRNWLPPSRKWNRWVMPTWLPISRNRPRSRASLPSSFRPITRPSKKRRKRSSPRIRMSRLLPICSTAITTMPPRKNLKKPSISTAKKSATVSWLRKPAKSSPPARRRSPVPRLRISRSTILTAIP